MTDTARPGRRPMTWRRVRHVALVALVLGTFAAAGVVTALLTR